MSDLAQAYEQIIAALTIWRESRGESKEAQIAVLWVIMNRKADPRWPNTTSEVCLQAYQFSSFNPGDPNAVKMPHHADPSWQRCLEVVESPGVYDPTAGANHYHSLGDTQPKPRWADPKKITVKIGHFTFYRL